MSEDNDHPEIEDRLTAELALVHTEVHGVREEVAALRTDVGGLRADLRQGLAANATVLEAILAQLRGETGNGHD